MSKHAEPKTRLDLPTTAPIFPLGGALLLPRGRLPLNIFEPRYLNMVDDALASHRVIGMVQTKPEDGGLYDVGCLGRITSFSETGDGRYLITLTGACRFHIARELKAATPYRQAEMDYAAFAGDIAPPPDGPDDGHRPEMLATLRDYLTAQSLDADWESIERADEETLVNSLSMICPFDPREKQALLEAPTLTDRSDMLVALMEMALANEDDGPQSLQ